MDEELLVQCTLIADAKESRLSGFSFITSLGRAFHAGPGTVSSGHAVTWLQDCPALLLGISGSGGDTPFPPALPDLCFPMSLDLCHQKVSSAKWQLRLACITWWIQQ